MYYEEQIINGVLCWRSTPNGEWTRFTAKELTDKLHAPPPLFRAAPDLLAALHTAQGDYMMLYAEAMARDRNITRIVDMVHTAMTAMDAAIKRAKGAS